MMSPLKKKEKHLSLIITSLPMHERYRWVKLTFIIEHPMSH